MTTPMSVRMERSLLPHSDWSASLKASISFIEKGRRHRIGSCSGNQKGALSLAYASESATVPLEGRFGTGATEGEKVATPAL